MRSRDPRDQGVLIGVLLVVVAFALPCLLPIWF